MAVCSGKARAEPGTFVLPVMQDSFQASTWSSCPQFCPKSTRDTGTLPALHIITLLGTPGLPPLTRRTKEIKTQTEVSETCSFFLLIVNLFTTNIVKEFSNQTRKNLEDFS